jgi:hypothetical protein
MNTSISFSDFINNTPDHAHGAYASSAILTTQDQCCPKCFFASSITFCFDDPTGIIFGLVE